MPDISLCICFDLNHRNLHPTLRFTKVVQKVATVELQWLEHLWDHENQFESGVVRAVGGLL